MGPAVIKSPWVIEPFLAAAAVTMVDEIADIFSSYRIFSYLRRITMRLKGMFGQKWRSVIHSPSCHPKYVCISFFCFNTN